MSRWTGIVIVLAVVAFVVGWSRHGKKDDATPSVKDRRMVMASDIPKLKAVFDSLLSRADNESFVIIEEPATRKFIQFEGSKNTPLFLDLPQETLNDQEMTRAKTFFKELGVPPPEPHDLYDLKGNVSGKLVSFQMGIGRDSQRAAEITSAVFERVFNLTPDTQLAATIDVGVSDAELRKDGVPIDSIRKKLGSARN